MENATIEWITRPNRWVAVDAASTTQLTYAPQVNPAPLTVSVPGQNPVLGSLEVVITNPTANAVQVEEISFEIQVGQAADALTPTTEGILTAVSGTGWMVNGPSGVVTGGLATYVLQPQVGTTVPLPAGSSVVVQIFQFQTVQQPGTTTIAVKELTQAPAPGFTQFQITTFPTGFYFGALVATVQQGSALVPVAQVPTGQAVTLVWSSSVVDATAYTIYYATAAGQQHATPGLAGEWTSPPLSADTVFTVVVTAAVEGGEPQTASLAVPVGVQNPSLLVASLAASGAVRAQSVAATGSVTAQSVAATGNVTGQSLSTGNTATPPAGVGLHVCTAQSVRFDMGSGTMLSLGAPGQVMVDAPGVPGGRLVVNDSSQVGINNPNPAYTLDVGGSINATGAITTVSGESGGLVIGSWSLQEDGQGNLDFSFRGNTVAQLSSGGVLFVGGKRALRDTDPVWIDSPGRGAALNASSKFGGGANGWVATAYWMQGPDGDSNLSIQFGNPF